jgi:hypothetical protein
MMITYDRIKLLNHDRIENGDLEVTDLSDSDTEKTGTKVTIRIPIMNRSIASP